MYPRHFWTTLCHKISPVYHSICNSPGTNSSIYQCLGWYTWWWMTENKYLLVLRITNYGWYPIQLPRTNSLLLNPAIHSLLTFSLSPTWAPAPFPALASAQAGLGLGLGPYMGLGLCLGLRPSTGVHQEFYSTITVQLVIKLTKFIFYWYSETASYSNRPELYNIYPLWYHILYTLEQTTFQLCWN